MPDIVSADEALRVQRTALAAAYHERSKHRLERYANGPETLDWDAQPDPFRRYRGAPLQPLPLLAQDPATPWDTLHQPGAVAAQPFGLASLGALFELSLALAAWKQAGPDRWSVRINPSSGNLHPTEGWLLCQGVPGLADGVHHYAPHEHALELRAALPAGPAPTQSSPRVFIALSSIAWREAWKYGERALRYCLLDAGHATGALAYAAALQGWQLQPRPVAAADLAAWLGLDRDMDFPGGAEREEPELLFELRQPDTPPAPLPGEGLTQPLWQGQANRLDAHPMYRWPVINQTLEATRPTAGTATTEGPLPPAPPPSPQTAPEPAASLIRRRRSAQRFDAQARLDLPALWPLLQALLPGRLPFAALPEADHVHVLLFAHRVDGLEPGAYLLPRSEAGATLLRRQLPVSLDWAPVAEAPADVPLWRLAANPALAGTLRTLNCHQALGSDAILGLALLAEFQPLPTPWAYRERLMEAGLLGQALYLQAESLGLAGTGIGCFFDDALHQLIGLTPTAAPQAALQTVYHFTIGRALTDSRIATTAPYAHLPAWPERLADASRSPA